ncbi:uncharacterized protein LOC144436240 isoform X2 [Glandiceps talaboti]
MTDRFQTSIGAKYGRSYHFGTLSGEDEVKQTYKHAEDNGKLPLKRRKVLFLGDARVGKTSLRRLLTGEKFQTNEESTVGIDTSMYEVNDVDSSWKESGKVIGDEYKLGASWYTAKTLMNTPSSDSFALNTDQNKSKPKENICCPQYVKYTVRIIVMFILMFIFADIIHCSFGFGILQCFCCLVCRLSTTDSLVCYRYGTGVAIVLLFESYFRRQQNFEESPSNLGSSVNDSEVSNLNPPTDQSYQISMTAFLEILFLYVIILTCFVFMGIVFGLGLRSGIAFGLCLMLPPQKIMVYSNRGNIVNSLAAPVSLGTFVVGIGMMSGVVLYRYRDTLRNACLHLSSMKKLELALLLPLFAILHCAAAHNCKPIFFPFLFGILIWVGTFVGISIGRKINLYLSLGYFTKRTFGLLFGLVLGRCLDWEMKMPESYFMSALVGFSLMIQPIADLYIFLKVKRQHIPVVYIREALKCLVKGTQYFATRLSLWDFAGQDIYYSMHHIFISSNAVYLVVFSIEEASKDKEKQLRRLLFWLNSICVHAKDKDSAIFLIGTHKDSVSKETRHQLAEYFDGKLKRIEEICKRLVVNTDMRRIFCVENSTRFDKDALNLQSVILREVNALECSNEEFPISFLQFYNIVKEKRCWINSTEARVHTSSIYSYEEIKDKMEIDYGINEKSFVEMLDMFDKAGEIIYQPNDETLKKYIIFDPQVLVDVMKSLTTIPATQRQVRQIAFYCSVLEERGIANSNLLSHIAKSMGLSTEIVVSLLRAYDLICEIPRIHENDDQCYIVPSMLPVYMHNNECNAEPNWWTGQEADDTYYLDFGTFEPDAVFSRLITRCVRVADATNPSLKRRVFKNIGIFNFGRHVSYKLELVNHLPAEQNLFKVVLQKAPGSNGIDLLEWLLEQLDAVRQRDFPHMKYTVGVRCPYTTHAIFQNPRKMHIVDFGRSRASLYVPNEFPLLCEGRRQIMKVYSTVPKESLAETVVLPRPVTITMESQITDMPMSIYQRICDYLNMETRQGDWRDFAGELGHSCGQVFLFSAYKNPCDVVLRDWSRSGMATIENLLAILERPSLGRQDIIILVKKHIVADNE